MSGGFVFLQFFSGGAIFQIYVVKNKPKTELRPPENFTNATHNKSVSVILRTITVRTDPENCSMFGQRITEIQLRMCTHSGVKMKWEKNTVKVPEHCSLSNSTNIYSRDTKLHMHVVQLIPVVMK